MIINTFEIPAEVTAWDIHGDIVPVIVIGGDNDALRPLVNNGRRYRVVLEEILDCTRIKTPIGEIAYPKGNCTPISEKDRGVEDDN